MVDTKELSLTQQVVSWVDASQGWFGYTDIYRDLNIRQRENKNTCRVVMHNLCGEGKVERDPSKNGRFRLVISEAPILEWQEANVNPVDIVWPFKLETMVTTYPRNLIVVAGAPNAGKTAFCLNFIARNMNREQLKDLFPIVYFSSEFAEQELKLRICKFPSLDWSNFEPRERDVDFADVIRPNQINIIDYLEMEDEFWTIARKLTHIYRKLDKGIALIALQKKKGADMGRGAEFGLEKARLYVTMDNNTLKIVKGKNWAVEGENPNGRRFSFSLIQGYKFDNIHEQFD